MARESDYKPDKVEGRQYTNNSSNMGAQYVQR